MREDSTYLSHSIILNGILNIRSKVLGQFIIFMNFIHKDHIFWSVISKHNEMVSFGIILQESKKKKKIQISDEIRNRAMQEIQKSSFLYWEINWNDLISNFMKIFQSHCWIETRNALKKMKPETSVKHKEVKLIPMKTKWTVHRSGRKLKRIQNTNRTCKVGIRVEESVEIPSREDR